MPRRARPARPPKSRPHSSRSLEPTAGFALGVDSEDPKPVHRFDKRRLDARQGIKSARVIPIPEKWLSWIAHWALWILPPELSARAGDGGRDNAGGHGQAIRADDGGREVRPEDPPENDCAGGARHDNGDVHVPPVDARVRARVAR